MKSKLREYLLIRFAAVTLATAPVVFMPLSAMTNPPHQTFAQTCDSLLKLMVQSMGVRGSLFHIVNPDVAPQLALYETRQQLVKDIQRKIKQSRSDVNLGNGEWLDFINFDFSAQNVRTFLLFFESLDEIERMFLVESLFQFTRAYYQLSILSLKEGHPTHINSPDSILWSLSDRDVLNIYSSIQKYGFDTQFFRELSISSALDRHQLRNALFGNGALPHLQRLGVPATAWTHEPSPASFNPRVYTGPPDKMPILFVSVGFTMVAIGALIYWIAH